MSWQRRGTVLCTSCWRVELVCGDRASYLVHRVNTPSTHTHPTHAHTPLVTVHTATTVLTTVTTTATTTVPNTVPPLLFQSPHQSYHHLSSPLSPLCHHCRPTVTVMARVLVVTVVVIVVTVLPLSPPLVTTGIIRLFIHKKVKTKYLVTTWVLMWPIFYSSDISVKFPGNSHENSGGEARFFVRFFVRFLGCGWTL